jgi:hypothetical protein
MLPGTIDAHTHRTGNPTDFGYERLRISTPREALIGAKNARITLLAGFTTVRNVGAGGYSDVALRHAINEGDLPGPRMLVRGPPLGSAQGQKNLKRAFEAEVKVAFGTDAAFYPQGLNAHEFSVYVRLGMTSIQAIRTATLNAADLLGWSDKVGSIEPGKWADLVAVDGDPSPTSPRSAGEVRDEGQRSRQERLPALSRKTSSPRTKGPDSIRPPLFLAISRGKRKLFLRCDGILRGLGKIELRRGLRRDLDGFARLRVASHARLAVHFLQAAQTRKNEQAILLGFLHRQVHHLFQKRSRILVAQARLFRQVADDLTLGHTCSH